MDNSSVLFMTNSVYYAQRLLLIMVIMLIDRLMWV